MYEHIRFHLSMYDYLCQAIVADKQNYEVGKNIMVKIRINSKCMITGATDSHITEIKNALTLPNPKHVDAVKMGRNSRNIDKHLRYYTETENGLEVPRGFTGPAWRMLGKPEIIDNRRVLSDVKFEFTGKLRNYQREAVEAFYNRDFGVLECPTGAGKTVIALALIAKRKQTALVIVPTVDLMHQWANRAVQFLDGEQVGKVGGGEFSIKKLTIGIVNSVSNHLHELTHRFGHLIIDEAHRCPSKTFSEIVAAFDCRYMTGLTATPFRRDGLGPVINFFLGSLVLQVDNDELLKNGSVLKPEIRQIETAFSYCGEDCYTKLLTALTEDQPRNIRIVDEAVNHVWRGCVLIVSDRTEHLKSMQAILYARGSLSSLLTGKTGKKERSEIVGNIQAGKAGIVLSTVQLVGEGFDASALTTIVLATPIASKGRLVQAAGRVRRPGEGKKPMVIDFADNQVGVLRAGARKRLRILNSL